MVHGGGLAVAEVPPALIAVLFGAVAVVFALLFFFLVAPPGRKPWPPAPALRAIGRPMAADGMLTALALAALAGHLIQVNLVGPPARAWWLETTGVDYAGILHAIEGDLVPGMTRLHSWPLLFLFYWPYLVLHNTFVIVAPFFLAMTGERRVLRRLLLSYPIVWLMAQVGFFLFPADNPTVYLGLESALERVLPGTDAVFYSGTTISNTVPSLHVALAMLITLHGLHAANRRFRRVVIAYPAIIILSVVYLQVHWALDAVAGVAVGWVGYRLSLALERRIPLRDEARGATSPPSS